MIPVCDACQRDDLDAEETIDHLAMMLEHEGLLRALHVVHGPQYALKRFFELGGVLHLTVEEARAWAAGNTGAGR